MSFFNNYDAEKTTILLSIITNGLAKDLTSDEKLFVASILSLISQNLSSTAAQEIFQKSLEDNQKQTICIQNEIDCLNRRMLALKNQLNEK